jgi:2-hydroxy-6-oxonona-2,4-dienedioate hydrolase
MMRGCSVSEAEEQPVSWSHPGRIAAANCGYLQPGMGVTAGRNGIFGGWTRAGSHRVYVRVPTALKERAVSSNGDGLGFDEAPIVLVHGIGASSRSLKPILHALSDDHAVYAPDLPGFGLSDFPTHPLDVPGLADALRRWMLDNEMDSAALVAVSSGGQVAVDLAARYPELVERLVLYGPTFDPAGRAALRLATRWARGAFFASPSLAPHLVHDLIDAGPWRAVRSLRMALADPIESKLPAVDAPTLVVRGSHDQVVPRSWAEQVAELIPEAKLGSIRGGHVPGSRAAARLAPLIERFVADELDELDEPEEDELAAEDPARGNGAGRQQRVGPGSR